MIGVFIDNTSDLFQSGAIQQSYFTFLVIKNTGLDVTFVAHKSGNNHFNIFDIPVQNIDILNKDNSV